MRKLLLIPFFVVFVLVGVYLAFNGGLFRGQIEQSIGSAAGGTVTLETTRLELGWPLQLSLQGVKLNKGAIVLDAKKIDIDILTLTPPYSLRVKVSEPQVTIVSAAAQGSSVDSSGAGKSSGKPTPIQLDLTVEKGSIKSGQTQLGELSLKFEQKLFLVTPAKVQAQGKLSTPYFPGTLPITVNGESFTVSAESIKALELRANFAGLQAKISGASLLAESRHRWSLTLDAPDLSKIPPAATEAFARELKGSVTVQSEIVKNSAKDGWEADGRIKASSVSAATSWGSTTYGLDGVVAGNLDCTFGYKAQTLNVTNLKGDLDLSEARLLVQERLNKPVKMPTKLKFDALVAGQKVDLKVFDFKFAHVEGHLIGNFDMGEAWQSDLKLNIPNAKVAGLEKIIIPLRKSPLQGEVGLQMQYTGSLLEPFASKVLFEGLTLKDFTAQVDYDSPKLKIHGPLKANLEVSGEVDRGEPKTLKVQGLIDLKSPSLTLGPLNKTVDRDFAAKIKASTVGDALTIEVMDLAAYFGGVQVVGAVSSFAQPKINLKVASKNLSLNELRMTIAEYQEKIPKGTAAVDLKLNGQYDSSREWFNLPIQVSGEVSANIVDYRLGSALAEAESRLKNKAPVPPPAPAAPVAFLPRGYFTENLNLKTRVQVGLLTKEQLSARKVAIDGTVQSGKFKGLVSSQEIFGGVLEASGLDVPLFEIKPKIAGMVAGKSVIIEQVLSYLKPSLKGFATGEVYGRADFSSFLPSEPDFMKELKVKGEMTMEPVVLNTVKVGQSVNDLLKKMPIPMQQMRSEPLKGRVKVVFDLADSQVNLASADGKDVDGSELRLKGKVGLADFQGDLSGIFAWSNPTIKGCLLEGNSDTAGRMLIPVEIKGDLMSPGSAMVSSMASKIVDKALDCEKRKVLKNLPKEATKALKGVLGK